MAIEEIESVTALIEVVNNNPALKVGAEKSLNKDFIKKDGYLVINFDIKTVNDGQYHLQYYGGNKDQWQMEGCPDTVEVGDKAFNDTITIPVESGDVAIVDLEKSTMDNFYVGYNRIN